MKKLFVGICIPLIALSLFAGLSFASNNGNAKIALHVTSPGTAKTRCTVAVVPATCSQIVPYNATAGGASYDVYVCVYDFTEMTATEFGIDYTESLVNGLKIWSFTGCALAGEFMITSPTPAWPAPGSGVVYTAYCINKTFTPSGDNEVVNIGYFYLTAYGSGGRLSIIGSPRASTAEITDCAAQPSHTDVISGNTPSNLGYADFGSGTGYKPGCGGVPVEDHTWGKIKSLYR
ncbi:MAG: hypothetical protein QME66_11375 [Candidatus Eisenbacteria bacterium]|nr:hypothetical protein [Candidatus Eisenbacteria bacterium]